MISENIFFLLDKEWAITKVTDWEAGQNPAVFVLAIKHIKTPFDIGSREAQYSVRFDIDKGMFLDALPTTVDANSVKNMLRTLINKNR